MPTIRDNLEKVKDRICNAAIKKGRNPSEITLVAVSKTKTVTDIIEAYEAGQTIFGENYVQELTDKAEQLKDKMNIKWDFIGHLQRNKVKKVLPYVNMIHSVDSSELVNTIQKEADKLNKKVPVLIEVNIGDESSKSGCLVGDVKSLIEIIKNRNNIILRGLMIIPPFFENLEKVRPYFVKLAELRESLGGVKVIEHLSMGMSDDFEIAIEEGATIVRVGRAIFGQRNVW